MQISARRCMMCSQELSAKCDQEAMRIRGPVLEPRQVEIHIRVTPRSLELPGSFFRVLALGVQALLQAEELPAAIWKSFQIVAENFLRFGCFACLEQGRAQGKSRGIIPIG